MSLVEATSRTERKQRSRAPKKNSLAIVERAFRGTIEEQYGHIVWLSGIMRAMGASHDLLLRGPTVLFAADAQPRQSIRLAGLDIDGLPHYESTIRSLLQRGASVYAYGPDVERYGLSSRLMQEVVVVDGAGVLALYESHNHVWYW